MSLTAKLYDAHGHDRTVPMHADLLGDLAEDQLLWVDAEAIDQADRQALCALLAITQPMLDRVIDRDRAPYLDNYPSCYSFAVDAPDLRREDGTTAPGAQLGFIVGARWLLTIHDTPIRYLQGFTAQDKGETAIGRLSPGELAASLLDWHLTEYLSEVAAIEADVDKLDLEILNEGTHRQILRRIVSVRTRVSRLRALLAAQRPIFYGFTRPDFVLNLPGVAVQCYARLADRFDRAIDEVERTRDVVVGSFDLFTSMTTEQTNALVKALTLLTAIIGFCGLVAGLLGMNFELPFFKSGTTGFFEVISVLAFLSLLTLVLARWRKWL